MDVDRDLARVAHRLHGPRLEDAEEERLAVGRKLADLVQEEHSLVGGPEQSGRVRHRAGERALHMAEESRFGEVAADTGAVEGLEWASRALGRVVMEVPGDQLLPGARFAGNQDWRRVSSEWCSEDRCRASG